jgi:uncharacterized membrane protein
MGFLAPLMLLGTAAAAIPIALHFFFRSRYRVVPWAAMKFLLTSIEQTSRRLKFQELLLLLLRCAVLIVLAVALSRFTGCGRGGEVAAVFVIDNSYSMGAREGAKTRFELAKAAAIKAIDQLPPHSTVQIFTCGTTVSEPLLHDPGQLDHARKVIEGLELSQEATDFGPGLLVALGHLKTTPSASRELYLFSDMQQQGWEQNASEINSTLGATNALATIFLVRCGTQKPANAAIVGLVPEKGIPRQNELTGFSVIVRNTGSAPMQQVLVSLAVNGNFKEAESKTISELPAGQARTVTLRARFDKTGLHVLSAILSNDDLPGDNWLDQVIEVREQVKILVVDGTYDLRDEKRSASFFLVNALAPVESDKKLAYHVQVQQVPSELASGELLRDKSLCIFTNVPLSPEAFQDPKAPRPEFLNTLADFVRAGKGFLIFGGDQVDADNYNKQLGKRGLLPVALTAVQSYSEKEPLQFKRDSADLPAFMRFKEEKFYEGLGGIPVYRTVGLEDPLSIVKNMGAARTVMKYSNGQPAIVTGKVGQGEVMLFGTSAHPAFKPGTRTPTWNYLHLWPGYVPLMEAAVNHLLHGQTQSHNGQVGDPIRFVPQGALAQRSFILIQPGPRDPGKPALVDGNRVPLGPPQKDEGQGRAVVTVGGLTKAGVYFLTTRENGTGDRIPFAIAPDLRESANLEALSESDINKQLGFTPAQLTVRDNQELDFARERTNREWTTWLLALVLLLALAEVLLAWFCGRAW